MPDFVTCNHHSTPSPVNTCLLIGCGFLEEYLSYFRPNYECPLQKKSKSYTGIGVSCFLPPPVVATSYCPTPTMKVKHKLTATIPLKY